MPNFQFGINRRELIPVTLLCGLALPSCTQRDTLASKLVEISSLAGGSTRHAPGVSLVIYREGQTVYSGAAGYARGLSQTAGDQTLVKMTSKTRFRIASVSKMASALVIDDVLKDAGISFNDSILPWWDIKHPDFKEIPISFAHLLSHTSSIKDPAQYWVSLPGDIETIIQSDIFIPKRPGTWFEYCNLNFGILATLAERISGERFDKLAIKTFSKHGLSGGFNWSGIPLDDRANSAALYRRDEDKWDIQTDGPSILIDETAPLLIDTGHSLDDYEIGSNGTLFSPQGGLRMDTENMAKLARSVATHPRLSKISWRYSVTKPNGEIGNNWFEASGLGCFLWTAESSPVKGQAMIGHDGKAYGLYSGAWHLPALDAEIAFAITGTPYGEQPSGGKHDGYNLWAQSLLDLAAEILDVTVK